MNLSVMVLDLLAGVQTPNCIRATAYDAVAHDYPSVAVLSDATAGQNEAIHSGNIFFLYNLLFTPTLQQFVKSIALVITFRDGTNMYVGTAVVETSLRSSFIHSRSFSFNIALA